MAVAIVVVVALTVLLPSSVRPEPRWLLSGAGLLLIALLIADPGRINRSTELVRLLSLFLLLALAGSAILSTTLLIHQLIAGDDLSQSATKLLVAGNSVWLSNNIVFALLYWNVDGGGSVARASAPSAQPELAFPQHMNPALGPPGWRPIFIDYLYLGFTNALAFSPTDVMPLVPWAKITMALQSLISVTILGLVIARAVNVLT